MALCAQWQQGAGWFFGESVLFWFCQSCSDRRWMECRPWPRFILSGDIAWSQKFIQVKIFFTHLSADLILNRFGQIGAAPLRRRIHFSSSTFYSRSSRYLVYPTFHCVVHLDDRLVQFRINLITDWILEIQHILIGCEWFLRLANPIQGGKWRGL